MRKLLFTAAVLGLAASVVPAIVDQAQAAPAKSPYCNMASQANSLSWQQYYHCWGNSGPAPAAYYQPPYQAPPAPTNGDFCKMAAQANSLSWQEFYGCWRPHR